MKQLKCHELAPLFLRIAIGIGFIIHGWAKISRGGPGFEKLLTWIGVPFAHLNAEAVPYIELLGGMAIITGFYIRFTSIPLMLTMLVALFSIHIKFGFSTVNTIGLSESGPKFGPPGYEINIIYIAVLLSFILTGAGKYSIDHWVLNKKNDEI
ncbi:DoxX family protein [Chryseobacterium paludis]|uniref:DoxX family protein n=1 Tax=Chryseobacterium paludis TaxID=2956784 RepID=UPI0021C0EF81|nr:DoxX family protein [Chryseobacterium paludis]